jgi:hypothetical protein
LCSDQPNLAVPEFFDSLDMSKDEMADIPAAKPPAWPAGIASIVLSALSLFLFSLYSKLHWRVLFYHYKDMSEDLRRPLLQVLNSLEFYRVVALLALAFALWAFQGSPRWVAWVALPLSLLAVMTAGVIQ